MQSIYISDGVQKVNDLYGTLLFDYDQTIKEWFEKLAAILWTAFQNKHEVACIELNNYHPDHLGKKPAELFKLDLSLNDIRKAIACEYGFKSWDAIEALGDERFNLSFEQSVNHLLNGNLKALQEQVRSNPQLIQQKSQFGHSATLLHYVGSNGVEIYRQKVPMNLPEITQFLLASGASKTAQMKVYGGGFTSLQLLESSAHPYDAGIIDAMKMVFGA